MWAYNCLQNLEGTTLMSLHFYKKEVERRILQSCAASKYLFFGQQRGEKARRFQISRRLGWTEEFSFQNGQIRQLTCIHLMSYCSVSRATGGGGGGVICPSDARPVDAASRSCPASLTPPSASAAHPGTAGPGWPGRTLKKERTKCPFWIAPHTLTRLGLDETLILLYIKVEKTAHLSLERVSHLPAKTPRHQNTHFCGHSITDLLAWLQLPGNRWTLAPS